MSNDERAAAPTKKKTFRVWIAQVNQTMVEVKATDAHDALKKGYAKWRREEAHSHVTYVQQQEDA